MQPLLGFECSKCLAHDICWSTNGCLRVFVEICLCAGFNRRFLAQNVCREFSLKIFDAKRIALLMLCDSRFSVPVNIIVICIDRRWWMRGIDAAWLKVLQLIRGEFTAAPIAGLVLQVFF